MDDLLSIGLSNAVAAAVLALAAIAARTSGRRPALVHGLWLLVLLKLLTPPLVRIPVAWPVSIEPAPAALAATEEPPSLLPVDDDVQPIAPAALEAIVVLPIAVEVEADDPTPAMSTAPATGPRWQDVLATIWLAGSAGWFALALLRLHRFRRLLRFARPAPDALQARARRLAAQLHLRRCPPVGLLPGRLAPMLWAAGGAPRLLVPAELLGALSDEQMDTLLVHELAHLRRRDNWVRAVEFLALGLYWWHPVAWYACRELREAEEQCCDAWVVSTLPGAGRTYAAALLDALDFLSSARPAVPPLASGLGQVSDLKRRLTMIMRGTTPRALGWGGGLAVFALGAMLLPLLPDLHAQAQEGQAADKTASKKAEEDARRAELEQAQADLLHSEAQLQQKRAVLEAARIKLKAAQDALERAKGQQAEEEALRLERRKLKEAIDRKIQERNARVAEAADPTRDGNKLPDGKKMQLIHINILIPRERAGDAKELLKKIEALVEKETGGKVSMTPAPPPGTVYVPQHPHAGAGFPGIGIYSPVPQGTTKPAGNAPQDQRINDLEKKLEKVLHELHDLRKEMKRPQSGIESRPAPTPAVGAGAGIPQARPTGAPPTATPPPVAVPPPATNTPSAAPTVGR